MMTLSAYLYVVYFCSIKIENEKKIEKKIPIKITQNDRYIKHLVQIKKLKIYPNVNEMTLTASFIAGFTEIDTSSYTCTFLMKWYLIQSIRYPKDELTQ